LPISFKTTWWVIMSCKRGDRFEISLFKWLIVFCKMVRNSGMLVNEWMVRDDRGQSRGKDC